MTGELHPQWIIEVDLDGLDDAQIQTSNADAALKRAVQKMKMDGFIRDGSVSLLPQRKRVIVAGSSDDLSETGDESA